MINEPNEITESLIQKLAKHKIGKIRIRDIATKEMNDTMIIEHLYFLKSYDIAEHVRGDDNYAIILKNFTKVLKSGGVRQYIENEEAKLSPKENPIQNITENYHNSFVNKGDNNSQSGINQVPGGLSVRGNNLDNVISITLNPNDQTAIAQKQDQNVSQETFKLFNIFNKIYKWTDHKLISLIIFAILTFLVGLVWKYFEK